MRASGVWLRGLVTLMVLLIGVAVGAWSWYLQTAQPWWSATLGNLSVTVFLLVPAELGLSWLRKQVVRLDAGVVGARDTAARALRVAQMSANSLAEVRASILADQKEEHETELDIFRSVTEELSRENLFTALSHATSAGIITAAGVRSPVWETDVHYRYVINDASSTLEVRLETDNGTVLGSKFWDSGEPVKEFMRSLVELVRSSGRDLGVGLNDPTQSIQDLIEMLIYVSNLRAQELMGYRDSLWKIIERREGWYFTERAVIPEDDLHYQVAVARLGEMDWSTHLRDKGWYGAESSLRFARALYGIP
jgi:hypothetical protein